MSEQKINYNQMLVNYKRLASNYTLVMGWGLIRHEEGRGSVFYNLRSNDIYILGGRSDALLIAKVIEMEAIPVPVNGYYIFSILIEENLSEWHIRAQDFKYMCSWEQFELAMCRHHEI